MPTIRNWVSRETLFFRDDIWLEMGERR